MARKLCCFWCPKKEYVERELSDQCPTCKRAYGAPLASAPARIRGYEIQSGLSRGFYGAAYNAEQLSLGKPVVLKLVPKGIYESFGKSWEKESREHATVAKGTPFIAGIIDSFDEDVAFGGDLLPCHVAVLERIPGTTLLDLLDGNVSLGARAIAQVAADLLQIMEVFIAHGRYHNDLHAENIIIRELSDFERRADGFDQSVRAVAIDLGSLLDHSASDSTRLGDQHQIAWHLSRLADVVRKTSHRSDVEFRIAETLRALAEHLTPDGDAQRVVSAGEAQELLRASLQVIDAPWNHPLRLQTYADSYNAQVLESWHVPDLWFDPAGRFFQETTGRGPQVITGMRGCGKTILLRALHFHARASAAKKAGAPVDGMKKDSFLGVFASCQKLLNPKDASREGSIRSPFERLFVAYVRDAIGILKHLRSIESDAVTPSIDVALRPALAALDLGGRNIPAGEAEFGQALLDLQFQLADGDSSVKLRGAPTDAFAHLASVIRSTSPLFANRYILFLLDDVSTRYIPAEMVRDVISSLLFQHPECAFRITTEAQALERVFPSPGGIDPADPNRDYAEFDLGNEVYKLLSPRRGSSFVSEILKRRGAGFPEPIYRRDPREVLGDVSLQQIAEEIVSSSEAGAQRKQAYRGLSALRAVCVGDLGDVVKLYGKILDSADPANLPVSALKQSEKFLAHSAGLLHSLNRRAQQKKELALGFAEAAGELLSLSRAQREARLRQYTKLYVRIEPGPDSADVARQLFELLDAGVFVYDGGSPRSKTRDNDPVLQFKLSYRKLLGLASFIGLSDRDRFELSGEKLKAWLNDPSQAKRLLLEGEARTATTADDEEDESGTPFEEASREAYVEPPLDTSQLSLLAAAEPSPARSRRTVSASKPFEPKTRVTVAAETFDDLASANVDLLVLARGFEPRTAESLKRILSVVKPRRAALVEYDQTQGRGIVTALRKADIPYDPIKSSDDLARVVEGFGGSCVVDVSGMSKPFLFSAVRDTLAKFREVRVVHTLAQEYLPTEEDLRKIGVQPDAEITQDVLARVPTLLSGEIGPYQTERVHYRQPSPDRSHSLIASTSPKNDRLFHLLDERVCEITRLLVPPPTSSRRRVARAAAELAATVSDVNTALIELDTNDLGAAVERIEATYSELYFGYGTNVELGLTGSKVHAVACGAVAAVGRVAFAWYVRPKEFDKTRFTKGVGETHVYRLSVE